MSTVKQRKEQAPVLVIEDGYSVFALTIDAYAQLRFYFEEPEAVDPRAFATDVIARSWVSKPTHTPADVEMLAKGRREKLLRTVVTVNGHDAAWEKLRGSDLSQDERFYKVFRDRWLRDEEFFGKVRTRYAELKSAGAFDGFLGKAASGTMMLSELGPGVLQLLADRPPLLARSEVERIYQRNMLLNQPNLDLLRHAEAFEAVQQITKTAAMQVALGGLRTPLDLEKAVSPFRNFERLQKSLKLLTGESSLARLVEHSYGVAGMPDLSRYGALSLPTQNLLSNPLAVGDWFRKFQIRQDFFDSLREAGEKADRYERRWGNHRLSYLASGLLIVADVADIGLLDALDDTTATAAFVHLLEGVALDGEFVPELRAMVTNAPFMTDAQKESLDGALRDLQGCCWVTACNNFYCGLEGVFWEVAYQRGISTLDRTYPDRPTKELGFDAMIGVLLAGEPEFKTWMKRALYGTVGNPYRHGGAKDGHRQQALFAMVALAGWFQSFTSTPAWDALIKRARLHIPVAVERMQIPVLDFA